MRRMEDDKFSAVMVSKVMYGSASHRTHRCSGLETGDSTTQRTAKMLKMKTAFMTEPAPMRRCAERPRRCCYTLHSCTPEEWLARQVRPTTRVLEEEKLDLLGHMLPRDFPHPLQQVTFDATARRAVIEEIKEGV